MKIDYHNTARLEFLQAIRWYESEREGLGLRFTEAVEKRLNSLFINPRQGTKRKKPYREVLVDKTFPFLIVFLWDETEQKIFVSAIFHTSRNPRGKYRKRN